MIYPKVFIIILNYNGGDVLKKCLESVYQDSYSNKEVVVVDNNSTDGSFEEARKAFSKFNFIKNNKNVGFAAGNNVAIKWALEKMADYIFLLNNDAFLEKDSLKKLVDQAEKMPKVGLLSPVIYFGDSKKIWFSGGKINWLKMKTEHKNDIFDTDYITGCAILIKKDVFKKVGLLDEKFFLYYEDADFSYRAKKAGFGLKIVKDANVYHFEKSSQSLNKIYYLVLSGVIFFRKNSSYFLRLYTEAYLLARKIKNTFDLIKNPRDEEKLLVQKAYRDLAKK